MTRAKVVRVVVCAGGLGTRIPGWARYIPKEFYPVEGRPGIVHLLEEISVLGPAEVVIVCHPYYDAFTTWARAAFSPDGHDSYLHAARLPAAASPARKACHAATIARKALRQLSHARKDAGVIAREEGQAFPGRS